MPSSSAALLLFHLARSNAAKMRTLGVLTETLQQYGAVSEACALEMVHGICDYTGSDTAIAVTGIAGPGGGTAAKPVGLVYIAVSSEKGTRVTENHFSGTRTEVKRQTSDAALALALDALTEVQA